MAIDGIGLARIGLPLTPNEHESMRLYAYFNIINIKYMMLFIRAQY